MLKVDNRLVGRTYWKQQGNEAWGQSFSIELERVSGFHFIIVYMYIEARNIYFPIKVTVMTQFFSRDIITSTSFFPREIKMGKDWTGLMCQISVDYCLYIGLLIPRYNSF